MKKYNFYLPGIFFLIAVESTAQGNTTDPEIISKSNEWSASLQIADPAKMARVSNAIAVHLVAVRDWHNAHPASSVPAGINPATGILLTELDKDVIACSAKPKSVHDDLMKALYAELDSSQVEVVLDKYTIGKVAFTLQGYKSIVPDLTVKEEQEIVKQLKQARLQAIDFKNMKEISAIFEIYKTKCEQYLNNNGRNWRQLFKTYVDKVKFEKEAAKQKQ